MRSLHVVGEDPVGPRVRGDGNHPTCLLRCESLAFGAVQGRPFSLCTRTSVPCPQHVFQSGLSPHHPLILPSKLPRLRLCLYCSPAKNISPLLPTFPNSPIVQWVGEGEDTLSANVTIFPSWEVRSYASIQHLKDGGPSTLSTLLAWGQGWSPSSCLPCSGFMFLNPLWETGC